MLIALSCTESENNDHNHASDSSLQSSSSFDDVNSSLLKLKNDTLLLNKELLKSIEQKDTVLQIAINRRLGKIHADNFDSQSAINSKRATLLLTQKLDNPTQEFFSLNDLGEYYLKIDIYDESLRFYLNALSTSKNISPNIKDRTIIKELAKTNLGIGAIYTKFENKQYSEFWLEEAMHLAKSIEDKDTEADIYIVKGLLSKEKHQFDSAKIYFDKAIDTYITLNSTAGLGEGLINLGSLSLVLNNYSDAIISLDNALGTLKGTSEKTNIMKANLMLGKAYLKLYNYQMSEKYLLEAAKLSKELNSSTHNRNTNLALSEMYFAQNKIDLSVHYKELSLRYEDDISSLKTQSRIFNSYMEYERDKNKQNIAELEMNYLVKTKLRNIIIIITLATIVLMIALFFAFNNYRNSKKRLTESIISSASLKISFFNHISEELKSPITIIEGLVNRLKENINEEHKTTNIIDLEIIERQTQNINFLINETFALSQSNQSLKSDWVNGNIVNFVQYLYNSLIDEAESRGIKMLFLSNKEDIRMDFCKESLRLVITNILYTSIKNSVKNDRLILSVNHSETDTTCHISIVRKSATINNADIPNEFRDLVSQLNTNEFQTKNDFTLISQTIKDINGSFSFSKDKGNDASFNIHLPVKNKKRFHNYDNENIVIKNHAQSSIPDIYQLKKETSARKDNVNSQKELVMIVEDNQFMSFYISSLINNKYNVITCQNGIEALKEIEKKMPDIIITDLMMPHMDGNQLTEAIKSTPSTSHIPVIMNTVKESNESRVQSIKAGVDAFLVKPFIEEELLALVDQLLSSRKGLLKKMAQTILDKQVKKESVMEEDEITFIQKVSKIIYSEIRNTDLSPQIIADKMFMSTSHLNRKIKTITELSTTGYILNIRLVKSKKLLISTQKPIGDIALECGFSDFAYFSRTFKKEFGITPTQYQRMAVE